MRRINQRTDHTHRHILSFEYCCRKIKVLFQWRGESAPGDFILINLGQLCQKLRVAGKLGMAFNITNWGIVKRIHLLPLGVLDLN